MGGATDGPADFKEIGLRTPRNIWHFPFEDLCSATAEELEAGVNSALEVGNEFMLGALCFASQLASQRERSEENRIRVSMNKRFLSAVEKEYLRTGAQQAARSADKLFEIGQRAVGHPNLSDTQS